MREARGSVVREVAIFIYGPQMLSSSNYKNCGCHCCVCVMDFFESLFCLSLSIDQTLMRAEMLDINRNAQQ